MHLHWLVFHRKDLCEAKPGYRVGNFDQNTMLHLGGGLKHSILNKVASSVKGIVGKFSLSA